MGAIFKFYLVGVDLVVEPEDEQDSILDHLNVDRVVGAVAPQNGLKTKDRRLFSRSLLG